MISDVGAAPQIYTPEAPPVEEPAPVAETPADTQVEPPAAQPEPTEVLNLSQEGPSRNQASNPNYASMVTANFDATPSDSTQKTAPENSSASSPKDESKGAPRGEVPVQDETWKRLRPDLQKSFQKAYQQAPAEQKEALLKALQSQSPETQLQALQTGGRAAQLEQQGSPAQTASSGSTRQMVKDLTTPLPLDTASQVGPEGVKHASGQSFQLGKDDQGNLNQVTLSNGQVFKRNSPSEPWSSLDSAGKPALFHGNFDVRPDGQVTVSGPDGGRTEFRSDGSAAKFDAQGKLLAHDKLDRFSDGSQLVRDKDNRISATDDAHGGSRRMDYDEKGLKSFEVRDAQGLVTRYQRQNSGAWGVLDSKNQASQVRGQFSLNELGDVSFRNLDGTVQQWNRDGSGFTAKGDQVQSATTADGRESRFGWSPDGQLESVQTPEGRLQQKDGKWTLADGKIPPGLLAADSEGNRPSHLEQLGSIQVLADGTLKTQGPMGQRLLLTHGTTVVSGSNDQQAVLAYNPQGQLQAVREQDQYTSFGRDAKGEIDRVHHNGQEWRRGREVDGYHRWQNQDGLAFTGSFHADPTQFRVDRYDPATGHKQVETQDYGSSTSGLSTYDRQGKLLNQQEKLGDGTHRQRVMETGQWLETGPKGEQTLIHKDGRREELDPVSAELGVFNRNLDNNGNPRPSFNAADSAKNLHKHLRGADDEEAIFNELAGLKPEQLAQLEQAYSSNYGQEYGSLRERFANELGGEDLARAMAHLDSKHALGDAIGINQNLRDFDKVEGILNRQQNDQQREALRSEYLHRYKSTMLGDFKGIWSGAKYELAARSVEALAFGNHGLSRAAKAGYFTQRGDLDKVKQALSHDGQVLSDSSRLSIRDDYLRLTSRNLSLDIDRNFTGNAYRQLQSLNFGDQAMADAARARTAMKGNESGGFAGLFEGWGTDVRTLEELRQIRPGESQSSWASRTQQVDEHYRNTYKSERRSDEMGETSGSDAHRLAGLAEKGYLSPSERVYNAVLGVGTTESELTAVLKDISSSDLKKLEADYQGRYGRNLQQDVLADTQNVWESGGRFDHDVKQWLRGLPDRQTDAQAHFQERMHRLEATHAFERQGAGNWVSSAVTDTFHGDGARFDHHTAEIKSLYADAASTGFKGPAADKLDQAFKAANRDLEEYRDGKDQTTEGVATGVTVAAGVAVSIATAGAATPVMLAWGVGAGATANLASRAAIQGNSYTLGEATRDTGLGALDGTTVLIAPGASKAFSKLATLGMKDMAATASAKLATSAIGRTTVQAGRSLLEGTASGGFLNGATTATQDGTWDQGAAAGLRQVGQSFTEGAKMGGAFALTSHLVLSPVVGALKGRASEAPAPETVQQASKGPVPETAELASKAQNSQHVDPTRQVQDVEVARQLEEAGSGIKVTGIEHQGNGKTQFTDQQGNKHTVDVTQNKTEVQRQVQKASDKKAAHQDRVQELKEDESAQLRQIENARRAAEKGNPAAKDLLELAKDPDHNGKITPQSYREAKVVTRMHQRGELEAPVRGPKGTDAVEQGGKGQAWDIKSPVSGLQPKKGGYSDEAMRDMIQAKLDNGTKVVVDMDRLYPTDRVKVNQLVEQMGDSWKDKIKFYTTRPEAPSLPQPGPESVIATPLKPPAVTPPPTAAPSPGVTPAPNPHGVTPSPLDLKPVPPATAAPAPPAGPKLSHRVDPHQSFQDYLERPLSWSERLLGRKLPNTVGTPYAAGEQARMAQQLTESIEKNWGNPQLIQAQRGITIPIKDILFAQGIEPTVNQAIVDRYRKSGNFGQELLEIPTADGPKYLLFEGHHRTSAAMLNGETSIEPGRVYHLNEVESLRLAGCDRQQLLQAVQQHTRHLYLTD